MHNIVIFIFFVGNTIIVFLEIIHSLVEKNEPIGEGDYSKLTPNIKYLEN